MKKPVCAELELRGCRLFKGQKCIHQATDECPLCLECFCHNCFNKNDCDAGCKDCRGGVTVACASREEV